MQTLEAVIDTNGTIRLVDNVQLPKGRRALVSILDEDAEPLVLGKDASDDFDGDMLALADGSDVPSNYDGSYSREDIYFDHD